MAKRQIRSLEQLKINAKRNGWPWKIEHPNDERALVERLLPGHQSSRSACGSFSKGFWSFRKMAVACGPFELLAWWYRDGAGATLRLETRDGRRRFDKAFVTTGKKSAKSHDRQWFTVVHDARRRRRGSRVLQRGDGSRSGRHHLQKNFPHGEVVARVKRRADDQRFASSASLTTTREVGMKRSAAMPIRRKEKTRICYWPMNCTCGRIANFSTR